MTFLDLVRQRRSVRRYAATPVPRERLERALEAARLAPSACNSQPWSFLVVDEPESKRRLAEQAFGGVYAMNRFAADAPVLVVVITERSRYAAMLGGMFRGTRFNLIDVGIACEHFVLQAAEEGLGTCWLGWFDEKAVKRVLGLPGRTKVDILISVGFPAEEAPKAKARRPLDDVRRYR
ncbi:MAG: nitroreductase family protein [Kiritimatiellae bacterium]|nr:nitroreductase family protein [Kiritimatiellia bacterium]